MCGICVVVQENGPADGATLQAMCDQIVHRGPDSEGLGLDGSVGLGMRRLSIIDLAGGHQPISNEDRSLAVVFNGEIYNYRELRDGLMGRGHRFATQSDTEVLVHLYEDLGERSVERLRGMFAYAIHDRRTGRVFAARDRLGIKPLHYVELGDRLYLASEIKSLLMVPGLEPTLDEVALDQYFALLYIPAPRTIFREIKKLPPGHYLIKDPGRPAQVRRYWRLRSRPVEGRSERDWIEEFRARFDDAVGSHLVADVPLGVFLSGGVDSSAMVAAMSRHAPGRIKTFSVGFPAEYAAFDERAYARRVAEHFGTDHEEIEVEPRIDEVIEALAVAFDEPMGDSGAVPNYIVCKAASRGLKVALSGLGGDELAGGYERYLGMQWAEWYRRLPGPLRSGVIRRLVERLPEPSRGGRAVDRAKRFVRAAERPWLERFFAFSSSMDAQRRAALYDPGLLECVQLDSAEEHFRVLGAAQSEADLLNRLLCIDQQAYMVDDLLTVADRTSMAVSLEVRVPFLDHPLVEFMATMPGSLKIKGREKKYVLKRAYERDLPRAVLYRRKSGFSIPVARWLREDLREMVEDVLAPNRLRQQGYFDPAAVEALKREHFTRQRNNSSVLWSLLMFQNWMDHYAPAAARSGLRGLAAAEGHPPSR
jgi:asparagine synthase (glutamine-hydrolysing)